MFVHNAWIMKIFCLQYMNNENIKMFVCNIRIMKKLKYLLSTYELWKYLFKIHELWKNKNISSQSMDYENIFLEYMNYVNYELWKH